MKKPTTEETNAFLVDLKYICNKHNIFMDTPESGELFLIITERLPINYKIIKNGERRYEESSVNIYKDYCRDEDGDHDSAGGEEND